MVGPQEASGRRSRLSLRLKTEPGFPSAEDERRFEAEGGAQAKTERRGDGSSRDPAPTPKGPGQTRSWHTDTTNVGQSVPCAYGSCHSKGLVEGLGLWMHRTALSARLSQGRDTDKGDEAPLCL